MYMYRNALIIIKSIHCIIYIGLASHREECLLFTGHLLPVCTSVIITPYAEKEPQSLVAVAHNDAR